MKEAVSSHNAFFAALLSYAVCLKNTGAALADGAHFLPSPPPVLNSHHQSPPPPPPPSGIYSSLSTRIPEIVMKPNPVGEEKLTRGRGRYKQQEQWTEDIISKKTMKRESCWPCSEKKEMKPKPWLPTLIEDEELDELEIQLPTLLEDEELDELEIQHYDESRWNSECSNQRRDVRLPKPAQWKQDLTIATSFFMSDLDSDSEEWVVGAQHYEKVKWDRGDTRLEATTIPQESPWDFFFPPKESPLPVPAVGKKRGGHLIGGRRSKQPVSLKQIILDLDDHFLKASESTREVSQLLESTLSNFADNEFDVVGHSIDHSERVMHLITRDHPSIGKDDFNTEEIEILATVLNKILAWEKMLYDEIKAGEVVKHEYQKKVSLLNKQMNKSSNPKSLVKLKASISHLHTKYIVGMELIASTVAEINRIRDEQLYPKLAQLVDGMAMMWKTLLFHHESQFKIVYPLKSLDNVQPLMETSEYHYDCTIQLCGAVQDWHTQFCGIVEYQKDFIRVLHNWLKLSLTPIENNFKENVSFPSGVQNAPIQALVIAWQNDLDDLPDETAKNAIRNFAAVIQTIVHHQDEDLKKRERCETKRKELGCKRKQSQDYEESAVKQESEGEHAGQIMARDTSLASFRQSLPELYRAMSETAVACSSMYNNLRNIARHQ